MPVPKKRVSKMQRGLRRSHHRLKAAKAQYCPQCNEPKLQHRVCPNCGTYRGKEYVTPKDEK